MEKLVHLLDVAPPFFRAYLTVVIHTGIRSGEIRKLTRDNVRLETIAKGDKVRVEGIATLGPEIYKEKQTENNPKIVPLKEYADTALASFQNQSQTTHFFSI